MASALRFEEQRLGRQEAEQSPFYSSALEYCSVFSAVPIDLRRQLRHPYRYVKSAKQNALMAVAVLAQMEPWATQARRCRASRLREYMLAVWR